MKRRDFIKNSALATGALMLPWSAGAQRGTVKPRKLRFGVIADVHQDIMHDGVSRVQAFVDASQKNQAEFIMQLGDFCVPHERNRAFMDAWEQFKGPRYHLLGNHDMDGGYSKQQTRDFWAMDSNYYSFDHSGYHFIVLDGNDSNPKPWDGYHRYIDRQQQDWLKQDLENTDLPTLVFSHQNLDNPNTGVANQSDIRQLLETANENAGFNKVIVCICGHDHTDYSKQINNIHYVQINSASYRWVGDDFKLLRYSKKIDKSYPWIKYTIPYQDPLFAFIEINPQGYIKIEGRSTEFVGPGPQEMEGLLESAESPIASGISNFKLKY